LKLSYTVLEGEYARAGEASSAVKKVLKQLGVPAPVIRKIAIAMYEAEINMVIHANGGVVDVDILPDKVFIQLTDTGPGIPDIEMAKREGFSTASDEARDLGFGAGMGIPNMIRNSDFFNIKSEVGKGTTVEIAVNL
jgi:anti-sigma regulatory factor (Ser/Thr protein kinase)